MKITGRILLVALYCLVTVGMTVSTHFCAGTPVGTGLGGSTAEPDWCCGDNEPDGGCCTTTVTTVIVTDDHAAAVHEISAPDTDGIVLPDPASVAPGGELFHAPHPTVFPPGTSPPLTILHSCFLI
jgi:hypothetical protein